MPTVGSVRRLERMVAASSNRLARRAADRIASARRRSTLNRWRSTYDLLATTSAVGGRRRSQGPGAGSPQPYTMRAQLLSASSVVTRWPSTTRSSSCQITPTGCEAQARMSPPPLVDHGMHAGIEPRQVVVEADPVGRPVEQPVGAVAPGLRRRRPRRVPRQSHRARTGRREHRLREAVRRPSAGRIAGVGPDRGHRGPQIDPTRCQRSPGLHDPMAGVPVQAPTSERQSAGYAASTCAGVNRSVVSGTMSATTRASL